MAYPDAIGGGTLTDQASGYLAHYMPNVWAKEVIRHVENNLVCFNLFDRSYEKYLAQGGDTVVINPLLVISATEVNTNADPTVYDANQGTPVNLIVDQWYEAVVGINDADRLMGVPDYEAKVLPTLSYAVAKAMDTYVNTLFASVTGDVGTDAVKVDYATLLSAKAYLDTQDCPTDNRYLIIDPETLQDLLGEEAFINSLYGGGDAINKGWIGQSRPLQCQVFMTNNLYALNTNYHSAVMIHKNALAVALRQGIRLTTWREEQRHTTFHRASAMYGAVQVRGTWGCRIKTRS